MLKVFFIIVIASLSSSAFAEPLSLKGLNYSMAKNQMIETISSDGYTCVDPVQILDVTNTSCTLQDANITLYEVGGEVTRISFNCNNFNICSYGLKEVAQEIVDNEIVSSLEVEYSEMDGLYYFGRGESGEVIEITESPWGNVFIDLRRGSFGNSKPKFD